LEDRYHLYGYCNAGFILVAGILGAFLITDPKEMEDEREDEALQSAGDQFLEDYNVQKSIYSSAGKTMFLSQISISSKISISSINFFTQRTI